MGHEFLLSKCAPVPGGRTLYLWKPETAGLRNAGRLMEFLCASFSSAASLHSTSSAEESSPCLTEKNSLRAKFIIRKLELEGKKIDLKNIREFHGRSVGRDHFEMTWY
jgi:hypothetical protein